MAAERWRPISITAFEQRQMEAVRKELDQKYEAQTGLAKQSSKEAPPTQFPAGLGLHRTVTIDIAWLLFGLALTLGVFVVIPGALAIRGYQWTKALLTG